jgi:acyl carrier protein
VAAGADPVRAITDAIAEHRPGEHDPDSDILLQIGLDSLDYASVVVTVEDQLGVSLREEEIDWSRVNTIRDLAAVFERHSDPA